MPKAPRKVTDDDKPHGPAIDVTVMANAALEPGKGLELTIKGGGNKSVHPERIVANTSQVVSIREGQSIELRIVDAE